MAQADQEQAGLRLGSADGRWLIAASALGSGLAFLDSTVVNVALPAIRRELGGGLSVQEWVLDGYLLTLSALLLLGGALGDRYGRRRVFLCGLALFSLTSLACGIAPDGAVLIAARAVQGIGAALLVPGSLALIEAVIAPRDRGRAVGAWAGLSGVASAIGPLLGGWLVQAASWRWAFFINLPLAAAAMYITVRHVQESRDGQAPGRLDWLGGILITAGLASVIYALIEVPDTGWTSITIGALACGAACLLGFAVVEASTATPMLPLAIFRSRQFSGANLTTLAVYAALSGALFLLAVQLQQSLHYSALDAGAAMLPVTVLLLVLSPPMGALAQRIGPRLPMTAGPVVAAAGLALMARITPGASYPAAVLPAVTVFGLGLSVTVAPLTSAVLTALSQDQAGLASGTNNAVARTAGLFAVAVLPLAAGVSSATGQLGAGFSRAMLIAAGVCAAGGLIAWATIPLFRHLVLGGPGDQVPALRDGRADVALVLTPFDGRGLDSEVLVTEPLLVALPAADPLAARTTIRLRDLAGRRLPAGSRADSGNAAPPPPGSALVKDLSQLFNLVEVGELVWFLPAWVARRFPRPNIAYRPVAELPPATLSVAWLAESRSPAVAAFVRTAQQVATAAATPAPASVR